MVAAPAMQATTTMEQPPVRPATIHVPLAQEVLQAIARLATPPI